MRSTLAVLCLIGGALSCGSSDEPPDAAVSIDAAAVVDASQPPDASVPDATLPDATPPLDASPGGACVFNSDCAPEHRCECDMGACSCQVGPRGTGGVSTACSDGNDCASGVCINFAGSLLCTVQCTDGSECSGAYDTCADVAFVGRVCRD